MKLKTEAARRQEQVFNMWLMLIRRKRGHAIMQANARNMEKHPALLKPARRAKLRRR